MFTEILVIGAREMHEIMMGVGIGGAGDESGSWTRLADFPYKVYGHSSVMLGDDLYVFGGYGLDSEAAYTNRTFKLHIPTDTWSEVVTTNTPTARSGCSLIVIDRQLYMYGGSTGNNQCWRLDPTTKVWTQRAAGINSSNHKATTYSGKMFVVGGSGPTVAQTVRIYDPIANSWSFGTPFPTAIYAQGMDLWGGEIWLYGGNASGASAQIWSYGLTSRIWTERGTSPPARFYHTLTNLNGVGYSYGGYNIPEDARFKRLQLPDTWTKITNAPGNRRAHTANAWQGKMIISGGIVEASNNLTNEVWLYDPN